jgi:hypothetical protein
MKYLLLIPILFILTSCAYEINVTDNILANDNTLGYIESPSFSIYLDRFKHEASLLNISIDRIENIDIVYGDYSTTYTIGMCLKTENEVIIYLDFNFWTKMSNDTLREALLFHELGHCFLNRGHDETLIIKDNKQIDKSIMSISLLYYDIYNKYKEYYMKELFNRGE